MSKKLKYIVVGDVHGRFNQLNHIIKTTKAEVVFVCGDFGIWPDKPSIDENINYIESQIPNRDVKIYWTPGNHEWWDAIEESYGRNGKNPIEMREGSNIYYCPIGSVLNFENNNILFLGGADSYDKVYRTPKVSWWEQEKFSYLDADWVDENVKEEIDIIISHTCPQHFFYHKDFHHIDKKGDSSTFFLGEMLEKFKPKKWYFGHWHFFSEGEVLGCKWMCLNMIYLQKCYRELKL
jgi:Icc-related predicted phosphoesterase